MFPDLKRSITFRGQDLNSWSEENVGGQTIIIGNQVKQFDPTAVELRQFTEPLALVDGIDTGRVWLGARNLVIHGICYDATRGECMDRLAAIEAVMLPESNTMGFYDLVWYTLTGSGGTPSAVTASVRPNGLRFVADMSKAFGDDSQPAVLEYTVSFFAKNPLLS